MSAAHGFDVGLPFLPGDGYDGRESAKVHLPPRWFIRLFWIRRVYAWTGGRIGLWRPRPGRWGTLRITTIGRRTGREHAVVVGYFEDGPNLVTLAMKAGVTPNRPGGST